MRVWLWASAVVVLVAVAGMACGGGGGGGGGKATPTPDRPTLEAWLTEISLKTEDSPSGFGEPEVRFTTNEEAAQNDPAGPSAGLKRLDDWGRLLGLDSTSLVTDTMGTFTKGGTALIVSSISIFADEQGAIQAMQWGRDLLSNPADAATLIPNVSGLEGGPISFASVGDETVAAEFTGTTQPEGVPIKIEFTADIVVIRNGKGVAYIAVGAIGGAKPGPEVEQIIRILNDRMGSVLP